jgi:hypothetical protein
MPERIQRRRVKGWRMPENTVYVGRGTSLGNPFRIYEHCKGERGDWGIEDTGRFNLPMGHGWTRIGAARAAVGAYRKALDEAYPPGSSARWILADSLRGKNLACYCPLDQPCHADALLELANQ